MSTGNIKRTNTLKKQLQQYIMTLKKKIIKSEKNFIYNLDSKQKSHDAAQGYQNRSGTGGLLN